MQVTTGPASKMLRIASYGVDAASLQTFSWPLAIGTQATLIGDFVPSQLRTQTCNIQPWRPCPELGYDHVGHLHALFETRIPHVAMHNALLRFDGLRFQSLSSKAYGATSPCLMFSGRRMRWPRLFKTRTLTSIDRSPATSPDILEPGRCNCIS